MDYARACARRLGRRARVPTPMLFLLIAQWTTMTLLIVGFLAPPSVATHPLFLETNMQDAWNHLLAEGNQLPGGARGLVQAMLAECHAWEGGRWDAAECDRALYLEAVLEKVAAASPAATPQQRLAVSNRSDDEEERGDPQEAATTIALALSAELTFSSFFLDYAVPREPLILSGSGVDGFLSMATAGKMAEASAAASDLSTISEQDSTGDFVGSIAGIVEEEQLQLPVDRQFPGDVITCVPRADNPEADTVEGLLRDCPASVLENFRVPPHVAGDFAQRFRREGILPTQDVPAVEQFVSGWQTIHRINRGSSIPVTACPAGTNAVVAVTFGTLEVLVFTADALPSLSPTYGGAPCPEEGDSENISDGNSRNVTYLPPRTAGDNSRSITDEVVERVLDFPFPDSDLARTESVDAEEVTAEEDGDGVVVETSRLKNISGLWPHEPRYCAKLWPEDSDRNGSTRASQRPNPSTKARYVSSGDMLFVPSGGAISWRAKGAEDEAVAVRFCYVDASNFDSVKARLPLYAAVEAGAAGLLRAFRSPVFDASMERKPSAVSAADFLAGIRHSTTTSTSSLPSPSSMATVTRDENSGGEGAATKIDADDQELQERRRRRLSGEKAEANDGSASSSESSSPADHSWSSSASTHSGSGDERKNHRGRRGRKSFKEWQDDTRWDLKVLELTLPTLESPKVIECGRTDCTVEWTSGFLQQRHDQTKIGFNISFIPTMANASIDAGGYKEVYVGDARLEAEHSLERELLNLGITDGKRYTFVVGPTLTPNTSYRFSVSFVYGETGGPFSEPSKPARTAKITAPLPIPAAPEGTPGAHSVTLHFRSPHDDGGSLISWYHVMSRPAGANVLSKWQAVGMAAAPPRAGASAHGTQRDAAVVKVDNLLPGVAYQFRVCAQNDIGTSPWSAPSEAVVVRNFASKDDDKKRSIDGFHTGHRHLRLPNVTEASVTYAGETQPPPGEGFDPFEWEVHGPAVVLDDRAGKVRVNDSSDSLDVWTCHFSPKSFRVTAEVVVAKPADATRALENGRFLRNRVALVERGNTPIVHKVLNAQRAGALGVIVADDGRCGSTFDQLCAPGSDPPEGWAALDLPRPWLEVRVPAVLMLEADAARLRADAWAREAEAEASAASSLYDGWMN